ncbi:hypothetical protein N9O99_02345 [Schleiferiaceae bacterium]|nr:hypothetical protein [Schleiferiaceae bacterium]MDB2502542.1 hypothetical protein [Schleiferiaceae bacterium]
MIDKLNKHREATCRRQKEAWEETIKTRLEWEETILKGLKKEKQNEKGTPSNPVKKIPIVIWGLEASPSYFQRGRKKIVNELHENYMYNEVAKNDKKKFGKQLIDKWIKTPRDPDKACEYKQLIGELSKADFNKSPKSKDKKPNEASKAIHLVYDIFPEWHGLPVGRKLRQACLNEHYMCEKIPDFEIHLKLIESIFRWHSNGCTQGEIHFVWLATQQGKAKTGTTIIPVAHEKFFQCIKAFRKDVKLYYDPEGFFNGNADLMPFP